MVVVTAIGMAVGMVRVLVTVMGASVFTTLLMVVVLLLHRVLQTLYAPAMHIH